MNRFQMVSIEQNNYKPFQTLGCHLSICPFAPYLTCKIGTLYRMHYVQFLRFWNHFFSHAVSIPFHNLLIL